MKIGLDDVVAAETALSHVDGEAGRLIIRGHDLEELAGHVSFENVTAMLWDGLVPEFSQNPRALLGRARERAFDLFAPLAPHFHLVIVLDGEAHLAGHAVRPGEVWCVPARTEPFAIASAGGCDVLITYPSVTPTPSFYAAG